MSNCNRDLCRRHIPVVVNAIKRLANDRDNKKYIVLDLQLPATIDPDNYNVATNGLYNLGFPRAVSSDSEIIDATALQTVKANGVTISTDGFYITPTMRYTKIDGTNSTMDEYVVLDNNEGKPENSYETIPKNPYPGENMIYLKRTTSSSGSTVDTAVTRDLSTNLLGWMFRINIPWSMSVFYDDMPEKTQKEYDKLVVLMDNLTRFTDMRIDYLDENYENPKFETIIPFKNYATSNNGAAVPLTMAGTVDTAAISIIGEIYWRFYSGGIVFINHLDPKNYVNKKIRLTLAYDA